MIKTRRAVFSKRVENVLGGVLIAVAAVMSWRFWIYREPPTVGPEPVIVDDWHGFADGGHRVGSRDLPLTLVVFSDYECPHCRRLWEAIDGVLRDSTMGVSVIYRHYFNADVHPIAAAAATAAECAAETGRFVAYHRLLFANQDSLDRTPWMRLATESHVRDTNRFRECLSAAWPVTRIADDRRAGELLGIRGTPTFLLDDELWLGGVDETELRLLLTRKLGDDVIHRPEDD